MFMPGKAENDVWVAAVYRTKQDFEEQGFLKERLESGNMTGLVESWHEALLELTTGYLSR